MGSKLRLHALLIYFSVLALFVYVITQKVSEVQKNNNYQRCKSVVRVAKLTGKLKDTRSKHDICKYHLE